PLSEYTFVDKPLHMGRFPQEVLKFPVGLGKTKVLHYGYARPEWRKEKYRKYKELNPDAKWGIKMQYESILDPNPTLKPIKEAK
ncbi:MAG: glycosyl transferase, partial [Candidatus Atribacteria bacterium]|nr:glycosyl transferase [Candidatus Atribacteria bacterium]MCD6350395.1 glycosyl transferase [Candidatus Atribacteria bacterium]